MDHAEDLAPLLDEKDADLAKAAQQCMMAALDHSAARGIALVGAEGEGEGIKAPILELPPAVLRAMAKLLGLMANRQPFALIPQGHELSTQEAAAILNVSRPFVVKELEQGRIPHRKVGRHRRVLYEDLMQYQMQSRQSSREALQELADQAQELSMGY